MKIRNGFVSNSSSSSFVVKFRKDPKSRKELQKILFGNRKTFQSPYGDESYSTKQISETIWNDMIEQKKNNFELAKETIRSGYLEDSPDFDHFRVGGQIDWDSYYNARERFAEKKIQEFFNERKTKIRKIEGLEVSEEVFYVFHYGDEDGSYFSTLEHGGVFDNVEHIRISNH